MNNQSLVKCKEVGLQWNHFLKNNKAYNLKVIKGYTNCSDALIKKLAKNAEDAIQKLQIFKIYSKNFQEELDRAVASWSRFRGGFLPFMWQQRMVI